MSLTGLDGGAVEAAVRAASAERGGWFLIHYTSRDTVDVLSQGTKGVAELREAAEKYYSDGDGTKGPLFGMIDFRRRKVLIKLVPDDTSRLVKARVQVHWASVTSRFPNHESVLELTSTDQLTESNVTAHTELHSGRSSAGSNKKPVLDGISEEGVEERVSPLMSSKSSFAARTDDDQQVSPMSSKDSIDHSKRISALIDNAAATSAALQRSLANPPKDLTPVPEVSITASSSAVADDWEQDRRPSTDARSVHDLTDRRLSTQSGRPSTATESFSLYEFDSLYKPKVKLGPRPATASRPASKGSSSAALPSGLRASRPPSLRPKSRDSTYSTFKAPPPPPIPESSALDFMPRPRSSGQSVKSLPATLPKSAGMTREKQRLMRFREMYKEKENKRAKDKATVKEATPPAAKEDTPPEKVDSPNLDNDAGTIELTATISDPQAELPQRLSVISEASTLTRSGFATTSNTPNVGREDLATFSERPTLPVSAPVTTTSTSSSAQGELPAVPKDPLASDIADEPRPSGDSVSTIPASSPTSLIDSSELTNSTRATSVSDESDHEKPAEEVEAVRQAILETPTQTSTEDVDSESSTPTAAPVADTRHLSIDDKEKRRAMVAPLAIPAESNEHEGHANAHANASETDDEQSYDDELMDELDGAEVQEAFSVSVSKSPITPFFKRRPSGAQTPNSPASFILSGKGTPSPLPSPLPAHLERTQSHTPVLAGSASLARTASGSMLTKEIVAPVKQEQHRPDGAATVAEDSPQSPSYPKRGDSLQNAIRAEVAPKSLDSRTQHVESDDQAEADFQDFSPSSKSVQDSASGDTSTSRKSRISSATRVFSSRDKSPSSPSNPSLSRASSATLLSAVPHQQDDNVSIHKRRNLGTGVAAKIADLQRNFSRGSSIISPTAPTSRKSSVVSVRASSIHDGMPARDTTPPRSAQSTFRDEHLLRGRAMSKGSMRSFESRDTRTSTPPRNKSSGSIGKLDSRRFSTFNNPAIEVSSKPDTIQVKATIVRTDFSDTERSPNPTGLGLQHTSIAAAQAKVISTPEPHYAHPRTSVIVEEPRSPARTSMDKQKHRRARSSISSALGLIGIRSSSPQRSVDNPVSPVLSDGRRSSRTSLDMTGSLRSLRRRASASLSRSPSASRDPTARSHSIQGYNSPLPLSPMTNGSSNSQPNFPRSMSSSSLESSATTDHDGESSVNKRKASRASRMLKRMSNSMSSMLHGASLSEGSTTPNNVVPTVEEEKWVGADLGETNVQFPDTLLWKRRYLEVDTQGYLVLKPHDTSNNKNTSSRSGMTYDKRLERRYHLSQFFPPFAPDMERMEMPYSVVLDFREDGGTLQIAADSGLGQSSVLRVLSEAHRVCSY